MLQRLKRLNFSYSTILFSTVTMTLRGKLIMSSKHDFNDFDVITSTNNMYIIVIFENITYG